MSVWYQGHFRYALRVVITIKSMPWTKRVCLYDQKRYFYPIWGLGLILANFGLIWPLMWPKFDPTLTQFDPTLVHLTHFVTHVDSSNLMYSLTVVINFRSILWPKISGLYFQNWLYCPNLALSWPKFDPIWSIWLILSLMQAQVIGYMHWH